ncbi:glutamyl-tRNA synthetase [Pseudovirgaria hyperparasitica]|uniref:glutamate--tRNA ligase n=1 Tax=Pseudovirgaria hyperparasitica TaxID=470096 RepID=A0A6A6VWI3_9PEZI|nr:glutamyl-tRNA synthetase [Pseudovirgaria hyperparasitica]KAF2754064.1 glutamyl-tRNA synthetase [Pseudovirgaria hyperparasitica]
MTLVPAITLDVAVRANPARILPALLVCTSYQRRGLVELITNQQGDIETFPDGSVVQLRTSDRSVVVDQAVLEYLFQLDKETLDHNQQWLTYCNDLNSPDYQELKPLLSQLNGHLLVRSFVTGYDVGPADLAIWGALRGNHIAQNAVKKASNNVWRWYRYVETSMPWVAEKAYELASQTGKKKYTDSAAGASYDLGLPQLDIPIVTRFPPEPSGYLHIGHAKAALLNDYFAHKNEGGILICRFDDTNPSKESIEFQDSITEDLKVMEIYPDKTTFSSDYFQQMYDYAIKMIMSGRAFADDSELGKGDEDRKNRRPSKCRDLGIEETLARFKDMQSGSHEGQRWCLRARIAYDSPNGAMRDPVIYRCNQLPHHRTGTAWKIYPTYDFCAPILDSIEGVTLALRTNEYRDRNAQYEWMQEALGLRRVPIWDFSRMNFVRTLLSKRKLAHIIVKGKVSGWDDPRMPTIRGILRRGMMVAPLRAFVLMQGPSRNILNLEWGALWAMNRKEIDQVAPRHTAIDETQSIACEVRGVNGPIKSKKPKHGKVPELGEKTVLYGGNIIIEQTDGHSFEINEEITLMNWGNALVREITCNPGGGIVTNLVLELYLQGDVKKTKKKVTWLAASPENLVPIELVRFDYLITKDKLEKSDKLEDFLTERTEFRHRALADCNVSQLTFGSIIQFERKGFYRLDCLNRMDSRLTFFEIPSGRS